MKSQRQLDDRVEAGERAVARPHFLDHDAAVAGAEQVHHSPGENRLGKPVGCLVDGIRLAKRVIRQFAAFLEVVGAWRHWSAGVAVGVGRMPAPCRVHDLLKGGVARFPAELVDGLLRAGDEAGGVAVATRFLDGGDRIAADLPAGLDHFADGVALAVAEIVKTAFARLEREYVRLGEVDDVNVVADAGAVRSGVVGAKNSALLRLAKRDAQHVGDEMRLDRALFAEFLAATGGVEVAERHKFEPVQFVVPLEQRLEHQFALAVRVDWLLGFLLGDRHGVRHAVGGSGGAEDEFFHTGLNGRVEQVDAVGDVVAEIF